MSPCGYAEQLSSRRVAFSSRLRLLTLETNDLNHSSNMGPERNLPKDKIIVGASSVQSHDWSDFVDHMAKILTNCDTGCSYPTAEHSHYKSYHTLSWHKAIFLNITLSSVESCFASYFITSIVLVQRKKYPVHSVNWLT
ncbi:Hypothetical predicted protein [Octopus vulgaris]|uniref:Uncharacterized protein n=1 Tax=Octopus vulgaris TaxID=6645 RepID=A0AA36BYL6_OCTVU|nr:Hypothetical predicted protein [Octopus vulgaris]